MRKGRRAGWWPRAAAGPDGTPAPAAPPAPAGPLTLALSAIVAAAIGLVARPAPAQAATIESTAPAPPELMALETFDAAWDLINRTHFDPNFNGVDWDAVRDELRPRAASAASIDALRAVIRDMIGRLNQSHFVLLPQEIVDTAPPEMDDAPEADDHAGHDDDDHGHDHAGGDEEGGIGLDVRLLDGRIVITDIAPDGPADEAGVRPGWIIQAINGRDLAEELDRLAAEDLEPRLESYTAWMMVRRWLEGPTSKPVRLDVLDGDDEARTLKLRRRPDERPTAQFGNLPPFPMELSSRVIRPTGGGPTVGVIRFNIWMGPLARPFAEAIDTMRDADGIVLDLRGNPGGVGGMVMGTAGHFIDEKIPLGVMKTRGTELKFMVNPRRVNTRTEPVRPYDGPVAILVDAHTGSTSEVFTGGMQSLGRVRVFGTQTMGAALPAAMDRLPNGDVLMHAFADFRTPEGRSLEGGGVIPDEEVWQSRDDLLAGRDAPLEAAMNWIASESGGARGLGTR